MGYAEDLRWAEQNLAVASAFHANAVNAAFVAVQQAEQRYWERIRAFEGEMASVREAYERGLSTCAGITLYPDRVSGETMTELLGAGVYTNVSTGGNTRYGGGDCRTLSITIDFPNGKRIAAMGDPNKEGEARAFAALVMNTAAELDDPPPTLEEELARVRRDLDAARADTSELDAARAAYEAAYCDTADVQAAQQVHDELRARVPQQEVVAYEDPREHRRMRDRAIVIAVVAVLGALGLLTVVAALALAFSFQG